MKNKNFDDGGESIRIKNLTLSIALILIFFVFIIIIGLIGFQYFFKLSIVDSFYNSTMYVTGMGPITVAKTTPQKIFASIYAILGGYVFLAFLVFFVNEIADILFFPQRNQ